MYFFIANIFSVKIIELKQLNIFNQKCYSRSLTFTHIYIYKGFCSFVTTKFDDILFLMLRRVHVPPCHYIINIHPFSHCLADTHVHIYSIIPP